MKYLKRFSMINEAPRSKHTTDFFGFGLVTGGDILKEVGTKKMELSQDQIEQLMGSIKKQFDNAGNVSFISGGDYIQICWGNEIHGSMDNNIMIFQLKNGNFSVESYVSKSPHVIHECEGFKELMKLFNEFKKMNDFWLEQYRRSGGRI